MADLRARFPLTLRHLGHSFPDAASVEEFVRVVCAAHPRGDIPHRAVRDLVRYEAMLVEVPRAAGSPGTPPARASLAPHARLFTYGADLRGMLAALREGKPATPRATHGWVLLVKRADGSVEELWLASEEGWFVERFREPTDVEDAIEDDEERALFAALWAAGAFVAA